MAAGLASALEQNDPLAALDSFAQLWARILAESGYEAGCPIVAAALEGNRTPAARAEAASAFNNWEQLLAEALAKSGVDPDRTRSLATLIIAAIEGAVVLARAERTTQPLERVAGELRTIAAAVLPQHT